MPSFATQGNSFFPVAVVAPVVNTPVAGATVAMTGNSLYLTPAGTLATLTIKLPPSPIAGQTVAIVSTAAVTTLTMQTAAGGAVAGAPTALVANTEVRMRWVNATVGWAWIK
jgi:hypothetical protein